MQNSQIFELVKQDFGTPTYVYSYRKLRENARIVLGMPNAFGFTPRFAMKANPSISVLRTLRNAGITRVDASSIYEVQRAVDAGFPLENISLSTQMLSDEYEAYFERGLRLNLCSLSQLTRFGMRFRGCQSVGLRFNPGLGSGEVDATNVGGPASSFGIWHESLKEVRAILKRYDLRVVRIHTHIGSGTDVNVWNRAAMLSLKLCEVFPDVKTLNLGGGFKVARMHDEVSTDIHKVGEHIKRSFESFRERTGRALHLEIEPGNYLCTSAGSLVCTIQDVTSTSRYDFLKLDSGMTEILRPMLYGSQHNILLVCRKDEKVEPSYRLVRDVLGRKNDSLSSEKNKKYEYVIVGKCCESGDLLTCVKNKPARIHARTFSNRARIGDLIVVEGCGSYCSSMCAKHYNSYPTAAEVMYFEDQDVPLRLIRSRGVLQDATVGEICLSDSTLRDDDDDDINCNKNRAARWLLSSTRTTMVVVQVVMCFVGSLLGANNNI